MSGVSPHDIMDFTHWHQVITRDFIAHPMHDESCEEAGPHFEGLVLINNPENWHPESMRTLARHNRRFAEKKSAMFDELRDRGWIY